MAASAARVMEEDGRSIRFERDFLVQGDFLAEGGLRPDRDRPPAPAEAGAGAAAGGPADPGGPAAPGTPANGGLLPDGGDPPPPADAGGPVDPADPGAGSPDPERGTLVAVVDGQVRVLAGPVGGERAIIEPGPHVTVRVNGRAIGGPCPIHPGDEVTVEPASRSPVSQVLVRLSDDLLRAWVIIERQPGVRFQVEDCPPSSRVLIRANPAEEIPPPPVSEAEVLAALERAGIRFGVRPEAIQAAIAAPSGEAVLVAEGEPPQEPEDGRIEVLFQERSAPRLNPDAQRIDLFERGAITWVERGQVLAVCHPARPGRPGTNVLGEPIPVRQPKEVTLKAGKGVVLVDDGRRAVAAEPGRPQLSGNVVSVVPVYEVAQDAGARTGHIRFTGDVHIRGDVLDGVEVVAGGEVRIGGLVSHATVRAKGSIRVGRTIVASRVEAGSSSSVRQQVLPALTGLVEGLGGLLEAAQQLKGQLEAQTPPASGGPGAGLLGGGHGTGELVKLLIERKFWELPRLAQQLRGVAQQLQSVPGGPELAEQAARMLVGTGPLRIHHLGELEQLREGLLRLQEAILPQQGQEADVVALSAQNATVEASGRILLYGAGAFNSNLTAGKGVEAARGVIRGGQVTVAEGDVTVKELGGPSAVQTSVTILRRGRIAAQLVYPNVTISIGGQKHVFNDGARVLRARLGPDGRLAVEHLKADLTRQRRFELESPQPPGPSAASQADDR